MNQQLLIYISLSKRKFFYFISFTFFILFFSFSQAYAAQQTIPLNIDHLDSMLRASRPDVYSATNNMLQKVNFPNYPKRYGRCYKTQDLMQGFAREFKRECIDKNVLNLKNYVQSFPVAIGGMSDQINKELNRCIKNFENTSITPEKTARLVGECYLAARGLNELKGNTQGKINQLSGVKSEIEKRAPTDETLMGLLTGLATCNLKAMVTAGDMTERDKEFKKREIDIFLGLPGTIKSAAMDTTSNLLHLTDILVKYGLESFQMKDYSSFDNLFNTLEQINMSEMLAKTSKELLKKVSIGALGRNRALEEKGEHIVSVMNSCQPSKALNELEIYRNMVKQEFLEQRWSITKAEKNMWCNAYYLKFDKMSIWEKSKLLSINTVEGHEYREWSNTISAHEDLIKTITKIYNEFTPEKIALARKKEKHERDLIEKLIKETTSLVTNQCANEDLETYLNEVEMTKKRLIRARDSKCGITGLADEFQLEKFVQILDDLKAMTELQLKYRKETLDRVKNLLSFCKPSEALHVLTNAKEEMNKLKLFRKKITTDLVSVKSKQHTTQKMEPLLQSENNDNLLKTPQVGDRVPGLPDEVSSVNRSNTEQYIQTNVATLPKQTIDDLDKWSITSLEKWSIDDLWKLSIDDLKELSIDDIKAFEKNISESIIQGHDQCYADKFSHLEKQLKSDEKYLEGFLKKIDAEIQPIRRASDDCNGRSTSYHLQNIRKQLSTLQCNSAPGILLRLKEVDLLETVSGSAAYPKITALLAARACEVRQRFWGYGQGCFTEKKIADLEAEDGTTINCGDKCILCPKGFIQGIYNGSKVCIKCPKGKHFRNGCCR